MNRRSTCKQSGFFHIQSFIIFVLVIGIISSIGLYVLHKSKAGSNPYANGVIYSGYQQYNLTAQGVQTINTPSSFYSVAQAALPNDCPGIWTLGQKQTWNATKAAISCASNSSDTSHGYLSLVTVNTNYTSPTIIKKDKIQ